MGRWIVIGLGVYWVLSGLWQPLWLWWVALGVPGWTVRVIGGVVLISVGGLWGRSSRASRRHRAYGPPVTDWWRDAER